MSLLSHRPLLKDVNEYLMDVFGYCIAPINYGLRRTVLDGASKKCVSGLICVDSAIKELTLISTIDSKDVKEAVHLILLDEV